MAAQEEYDCPDEDCTRSFDSKTGVSTHHVQAHGESISFAKEETQCKGCGERFEYYSSDKEGIYCEDCAETESWGTGPESYERRPSEEFDKAYSEDVITGRSFDLSKERRGDVSEAAVEKEFLKRDVSVLRPVTDNEPYDLVAETQSGFVKVQVKTGKLDTDWEQ